jgi:site-specific recombinase XerD
VAFISMPRKDAPLPVILTKGEVDRVLKSFTVAKYSVFFALIYAAGLRISEAIGLETQDIDALRGVIHIRHAKGGGQRLVNRAIGGEKIFPSRNRDRRPGRG